MHACMRARPFVSLNCCMQELTMVPFSALRPDADSKYLIERYTLCMAPSLSALGLAAEKHKLAASVASPHMLLVQDPAGLDRANFKSLKGAQAEVCVHNEIKQLVNMHVFAANFVPLGPSALTRTRHDPAMCHLQVKTQCVSQTQ